MTSTASASTTRPAATGLPIEQPRPRRGGGRLPYSLVLTAAALLALSLGYPLVRQVFLSFHEYGLAQQFGQPADFVGLDNYRALVSDAYLWTVLVRTVVSLGTSGKLFTPVPLAAAANTASAFIGAPPNSAPATFALA